MTTQNEKAEATKPVEWRAWATLAVAAFTMIALDIWDDRRDRRSAFDRGEVAATCRQVVRLFPNPSERPSEAAEIIGWCRAQKDKLKP